MKIHRILQWTLFIMALSLWTFIEINAVGPGDKIIDFPSIPCPNGMVRDVHGKCIKKFGN